MRCRATRRAARSTCRCRSKASSRATQAMAPHDGGFYRFGVAVSTACEGLFSGSNAEIIRSVVANAAEIIMRKAIITKDDMALLKEASEMFSETGCVPGIDGEEVQAETMVPDVKEYIPETID